MSDKVIPATDSNFQEEVLNSDVPVLVDFWAPWCGPCLAVAPTIEEVATAVTNKAKVMKLNVDENTQIASKYGVMSIPTIIIFKKGEIFKQMVGVQAKEAYVTALEEADTD